MDPINLSELKMCRGKPISSINLNDVLHTNKSKQLILKRDDLLFRIDKNWASWLEQLKEKDDLQLPIEDVYGYSDEFNPPNNLWVGGIVCFPNQVSAKDLINQLRRSNFEKRAMITCVRGEYFNETHVLGVRVNRGIFASFKEYTLLEMPLYQPLTPSLTVKDGFLGKNGDFQSEYRKSEMDNFGKTNKPKLYAVK
jgi:hypothetical protein